MARKKKETFFWASYSDLMTSLFFIMLVLFVLAIALLSTHLKKIEKEKAATEEQLSKLQEIERSTDNIDATYFEYRPEFKKHIVKIRVNFRTNSSDMNDLSEDTRNSLELAGRSIRNSILYNTQKYKDYDIQYLLIIEGQASKDQYFYNYELSYNRALALKRFWEERHIQFGDKCEVLISGSGDGKLSGTDFMRDPVNVNNQRFLIHIVPKPGIIEKMRKEK